MRLEIAKASKKLWSDIVDSRQEKFFTDIILHSKDGFIEVIDKESGARNEVAEKILGRILALGYMNVLMERGVKGIEGIIAASKKQTIRKDQT